MNQNETERELAITDSNSSLDLFRAMYYQLNAKPDSISKAFSRKVIVSKEDIIDLNNRVLEKIRMNYQDDGYIASITANMSDRHVISFDCWEKFIQYNWTDTSCISSMVLQWNFNIRIPGCVNPQNHNLVVKLTNGLRPEELFNLIFSGKLENIEEAEMGAFPVVARVDFINTLLAEELLNIVAKWVDGLNRNEDLKNPFVMFLRKYRKRVAQYFEYIAFILVAIIGIAVVNKVTYDFGVEFISEFSTYQFLLVLNSMFIVAFLILLTKGVCGHIATNIYGMLSDYGKVNIFNITKGDRNRQDNIADADKINGTKIIIKLVISLIFNVGCGIIATLLIGGIK